MGNTTSDVTDNVKAQADGAECDVYKLLDVKGGGELIQMMKIANLTKKFDTLDEDIKNKIEKYLYNNGQGETHPVQTFVLNRSANKDKLKRQLSNNYFNLSKSMGMNTKKACWVLDNRGAVGETPLHICLLNNSMLHTDLAFRMVKLFPNLVHDIYLSDEYYGESPLHIAIVNEDPVMVKFLLDNGADVHQRCAGNFFCPDDQKSGRQDFITQECPVLPLQTNYKGYSYFGEYPLSFAAVMNQTDCIRLLMAKGTDANKKDSNGNTVLHMCVIHNQLETFKFLLDFGARLDIKNRLDFTPLTLAAKLARKDFFDYIMERTRNIYWVYANISCAAYPLTDVDTISEDGSTDPNSALYSIVNGDSEKHLELIDGVVLELLNQKWEKFIKKRFFFEIGLFIFYYILCVVVIIIRPPLVDCIADNRTLPLEPDDECNCAYLNYDHPSLYPRYALECIILLAALLYLILAMRELYIQKYLLYFRTLLDNPTKVLFLFSCVTTLMIIPFRLVCYYQAEDILTVLSISFMSTFFLYYCRGFRVIGPFILMIFKMIRGDLMVFFLIYAVFLMGYSQAMYIVFHFGNYPVFKRVVFNTPMDALMNTFLMSIGEFLDMYNEMQNTDYAIVGIFLFITYMVVVGLLMLNLLIAMMANTYSTISETKKEWLRQWAKIVLTVEQSVGLSQRLKYQKRYSHLLNNDKRAFLMRWKQRDDERQEFISQKDFFFENIKNFSERA